MEKEGRTESIHIQMYVMYAFTFVILLAAAIMSTTETWIFKPYKRSYAPPGISDGQNKSPFTPT
jgi:hypothetical protein